uniref:C3H1-type domain-containing protein n=1 Tax=Heterorhabditis bacteriophora TaxID=37862 RepID=A0A1I7XK58_HETBA
MTDCVNIGSASLNSKPDVENSIPDIDGPMITVYRTSTKLVRKPRPMNHSKDIETNSSPEQVGTALPSEAVVLPSAISLNNTVSSKLSAVSQLVPRSGMLRLSTKTPPAPLSSSIHTTGTTKDLSTNSKKDIPSKVVFPSTINKGLTVAINSDNLNICLDRDIEWDSDEDITKLIPKKILVLPEEQKTMNTSSSSSSIDISSDAEILPDGGCCNNQDNEQAHLERQKKNISSFSADRYIISPRDSPNIQMCDSPHLAVPSLSCSVANSPCSTITSPVSSINPSNNFVVSFIIWPSNAEPHNIKLFQRKDQYNLREEIVPITPPMPTSPVTGTSTLQTSFSIDSLSDKRITLKPAVPLSDGNNYRVPRTIKKSLKNIPINSRPYRGLMSLRIINGKRVAGDSRECFANLEGKCVAGIFCRFEHDGSTNHQNKKVCSRLLRGLCRPDANCSHHVLLPHQYPVCQFFLRVSCFEPNCQLLHVKHSCNLQPCEDFNKGICLAGDDCDYPHRYIYQTVKKRGIYVHEEETHRFVRTGDEDCCFLSSLKAGFYSLYDYKVFSMGHWISLIIFKSVMRSQAFAIEVIFDKTLTFHFDSQTGIALYSRPSQDKLVANEVMGEPIGEHDDTELGGEEEDDGQIANDEKIAGAVDQEVSRVRRAASQSSRAWQALLPGKRAFHEEDMVEEEDQQHYLQQQPVFRRQPPEGITMPGRGTVVPRLTSVGPSPHRIPPPVGQAAHIAAQRLPTLNGGPPKENKPLKVVTLLPNSRRMMTPGGAPRPLAVGVRQLAGTRSHSLHSTAPNTATPMAKQAQQMIIHATTKLGDRVLSGQTVEEFNRLVEQLNSEISRLQEDNRKTASNHRDSIDQLQSSHQIALDQKDTRIKQLESQVDKLQRELGTAMKNYHAQLLINEMNNMDAENKDETGDVEETHENHQDTPRIDTDGSHIVQVQQVPPIRQQQLQHTRVQQVVQHPHSHHRQRQQLQNEQWVEIEQPILHEEEEMEEEIIEEEVDEETFLRMQAEMEQQGGRIEVHEEHVHPDQLD